MSREDAQREVDLDLNGKDEMALLYDIHDEIINHQRDRSATENLMHATKRFASLNTMIALKQRANFAALLASTGELLEAAQTGASTQEAYAADAQTVRTKAKETLDSILTFGKQVKAASDKTEGEVKSLTKRMYWLTLAGAVFALSALVLQWLSWQHPKNPPERRPDHSKQIAVDAANPSRSVQSLPPALATPSENPGSQSTPAPLKSQVPTSQAEAPLSQPAEPPATEAPKIQTPGESKQE